MATYSFVSAWKISAPPHDVWEYIGDPLRWQLFWPGLEEVKLLDEPGSPGTEAYEFVFKSFLPFRVVLQGHVTSKQPPHRLVMKTRGQLEGTGKVELQDSGDGFTHSRMTWDTRSTVAWMNLTAPLLRGLFEWNHDLLMKRAGEGLARRLDAPVVEAGPRTSSLPRALLPFAFLAVADRKSTV